MDCSCCLGPSGSVILGALFLAELAHFRAAVRVVPTRPDCLRSYTDSGGDDCLRFRPWGGQGVMEAASFVVVFSRKSPDRPSGLFQRRLYVGAMPVMQRYLRG